MNLLRLAPLGALLFAAPLFSQAPPLSDPQVREGVLEWFSLNESRDFVVKALGNPAMMAAFGDFVSWQYQIGIEDTHEFSHQVVFRAADGSVVSVTRNYEQERTVDEWFPESETFVHYFPNAEHPQYSVRVRRLSGGRVLLAMGVSKAGQRTGQVVLMRESELRFFHPWLFEQLRGK